MADITAIIRSEDPLNERQLSVLARSGLREYLSGGLNGPKAADLILLWSRLVEASYLRNVSEKHLTTACNAISVYMNLLSKSSSEESRRFIGSRDVWLQSYACAQYTFTCGKTKPALQMLETLANLLNEHSDKRLAHELLQNTSQTIIGNILTDEPRGTIKASCISLSCLLRKTPLQSSLETAAKEALDQHTAVWVRRLTQAGLLLRGDSKLFTGLQELLLALLFAVNNLETRSASLKLFSQICTSDLQTKTKPLELAARVLEYYIEQCQDVLGDFASNVLPVLIDSKASFESLASAYTPTQNTSSSRFYLFLIVLKAGRMQGFLAEKEMPVALGAAMHAKHAASTVGDDEYQSFDKLLQAGDAGTRIHAYDLLTASYATTASVSTEVLDCLQRNFRYLHDDNDAHERGEIISTTRRFLKRLDSSFSSLKKLRQMGKASEKDIERVTRYESFVGSFLESISQELEVGISYPRHIIALGNLQLILLTSFDHWCQDRPLIARLLCLVSDPYDDVRAVASSVLTSMQIKLPQVRLGLDQQIVQRALSLSSYTCRNDHADAAGRLMVHSKHERPAKLTNGDASDSTMMSRGDAHEVLESLDSHLSDLQVLRPKTTFPLHSYILTLVHTYAVNAINDEEAEMVLSVCNAIWRLVQPELCIDSPETGTEDSDEVNLGGPKDVLAFAWRALRDSSLLLQSVMRTNRRWLTSIGSLCIENLIMLRHRGAFSTVAQTFTMCCEEARSSKDPTVRQLLRAWYVSALDQIDEQASKVTRRSAGIPAMFNAILSPYDEALFREAMLTLKDRAAEDLKVVESPMQSLPQVHALNCIKDVITNSKFRAVSEQFILEMIELAADRMSSSIWAIRNCGLMLLRACMNRLDPKMLNIGDDSQSSTGLNSPAQVALKLFQRAAQSADSDSASNVQRSETIFAALDLVRHIGPTHGRHDDPFYDMVRQNLSSPLWAIRQHAASVLAARMALNHTFCEILQAVPVGGGASENEVHGTLLLYRAACRVWKPQADEDAWERSFVVLAKLFENLAERFRRKPTSPIVQNAALDIASDCICASFATSIQTELKSSMLRAVADLLASTSRQRPISRQRALLYSLLPSLGLGGLDGLPQDMNQIAPENTKETITEDCAFAAGGLQQAGPGLASLPKQIALLELLPLILEHVEEPPHQLLMNIAISSETHEISMPFLDMIRLLNGLRKGLLEGMKKATITHDREMWNSHIRISAHVNEATFHRDAGAYFKPPDFRMPTKIMKPWLQDIELATKDELELPTRLNAAEALRVFTKYDEENLKTFLEREDDIHLQLLLVVYDQLNDDDEEIRQVAQYTAQRLLPQSTSCLAIRPCALAAREALLRIIAENFRRSETVSQIVAARVVGSRASVTYQKVSFIPVKARLADIMSSMNDLFAEEKQNLYIDELDEIRKWSRVLAKCSIQWMPVRVERAAATWAMEGLTILTQVLANEQDSPDTAHGMGLTYNVAVLELGMRVIYMAKALLSLMNKAGPGDVSVINGWKTGISNGLDELAVVLHDTEAHPSLVKAVEADDI